MKHHITLTLGLLLGFTSPASADDPPSWSCDTVADCYEWEQRPFCGYWECREDATCFWVHTQYCVAGDPCWDGACEYDVGCILGGGVSGG
jgi:hypothetical protein